MILMPQIFDVTTNENARYKRNELELYFRLENALLHGVVGDNCVLWGCVHLLRRRFQSPLVMRRKIIIPLRTCNKSLTGKYSYNIQWQVNQI